VSTFAVSKKKLNMYSRGKLKKSCIKREREERAKMK
jgi:hypothetical protein